MDNAIVAKINLIGGGIVAVLSYIFGAYWFLFIGYLALNMADFITRWIAARMTKTEKSSKAAEGIFKKVAYWILIALSFGMSSIFVEIGNSIHVDLSITKFLGLFVLCALIINEIRSVLENLSEVPGLKIPKILIKGLEVANKAVESVSDAVIPDDDKNV